MSALDLERFRAETQENPRLLQELSAMADDSAALARWTSEKGYDLTPAELTELAGGGELSDDDLEQAAGGWADPPPPPDGTGGGGGG